MRSLTKSLAGGVLAALLVLSASPAQAFSPQDPAPETEQSQADADANGTESLGDNAEQTEGTDTADETDSADSAEASENTDAVDGTKVELPETEVSVEEPTEGHVSEDPAISAEEAPVVESPTSMSFSGTVTFVPHESQHTGALVEADESVNSADDDETVDAEMGGRFLIATDAGPLLPVTQDQVNAPLEIGQTITGTLELSASAQDAVNEEIAADEGDVTSAEVLEIAEEAASAEGNSLAIAGAVAGAPAVAAAASTKSHTADVVFVNGGPTASDTTLKGLVSNSSTYWNGQTAGKVSKITPNSSVKRINISSNRCDTDSIWSKAAKATGRSTNYYLSGARHLIVFVNAGAGCPGSGYGTLGTLHQGGLIWVDLQAIGQGGSLSNAGPTYARGTTAHEFGHNLGLGHGQARLCSGATVDAQTAKQYYAPYGYSRDLPKSPCNDREYGDVNNIMGAGSAMSGAKPTALSVVQKNQLGVLPSGSLKTVSASGGRSQTFTIKPASGNSGLRGLKVNSTNGGSFVVEYRSGTGQDSGLPWADGSVMHFTSSGGALPTNYMITTGVQVTKNYPGKLSASHGGGNDHRETLITSNQSTGKYVAMKSGRSVTPWNNNARITVVSMNSTGAKVRVDYTPFIDVPYGFQYSKEINWMSSAKISIGNSAGSGLRKYSPKSDVSRSAMAAFLFRLQAPKGYKAPKSSYFADVKPSDTYYKEISWMYAAKISKGVAQSSGKPKYLPKTGVSRSAMAVFIYRMDKAKKPAVPKKSPFADITPKTQYYKEMAWMYTKNISTGVTKNGKRNYVPKSNVTRSAMAAFLYRYKHPK